MKEKYTPLLTAQFEMVGPHLAEEYLRLSVNFRKPIPAHVKALAEQMRCGKWVDNGYPMRFRVDGKFIDGQNRCHAIIDAGLTFRILVVRNVPFEAEVTIDEGGKSGIQLRTLAEHLHSLGIGDSASMASIVRNVFREKNGIHGDKSGKILASTSQFLELFSQNRPKFEKALSISVTSSLVPRSIGGLIAFMAPDGYCSDEDRERGCSWEDLVERFLKKVEAGIGGNDDPAALLHFRILTHRESKAKLPMSELCAISIKAWNYWHQGKPVKRLSWARVGAHAEPFPQIQFVPR